MRIAMARVATPANQVKTCSTGSRPRTAKTPISTTAVTVCTSDDTCGDRCVACTAPSRSGSTPAFAIECW